MKKEYIVPACGVLELDQKGALLSGSGNGSYEVDTNTGADDSDVLSGSFDGVEFDWDKEAWQ